MKIAQISKNDLIGGAAKIAWSLHQAYLKIGHESWMLVAQKTTVDHSVIGIPTERPNNCWQNSCARVDETLTPLVGKVPGIWKARAVLSDIAEPWSWIQKQKGIENFEFPATNRILDFLPKRLDILHCHNLHGGYFDLRAIPELSRQLPVVMTLHDAWLLSGHCAHSLGCNRWINGCGDCPDLTIYPAIKRDATAFNWKRKQQIFAKSRLYVATPSEWLMEKVRNSMLEPAIIEGRVIHNGVNLDIFAPSDKLKSRVELGLPSEAKVLVFAANGIRDNIFKDFETMRYAVHLIADEMKDETVLFLAIGEDLPPEKIGAAKISYIPPIAAPLVAKYFQAADLYLHAAKADTFPNTIIEALACGTPVVATAVGGIPEQVKGLNLGLGSTGVTSFSNDEATGALVASGNHEEMASATITLLQNPILMEKLGCNARRDAIERFGLNQQANSYLEWFKEIAELVD